MQLGLFISVLSLLPALGTPLAIRDWLPAEGTVATCDANSDKYISLFVGPEQLSTIPPHACQKLLPPCAYIENVDKNTACPAVIDWRLPRARNTTLNALVESKADHSKLSDWAVNCKCVALHSMLPNLILSVAIAPAPKADVHVGTLLTKDDCEGYFKRMLTAAEPDGCSLQGLGPTAGNLTVGGTSASKGAIFSITFVKRA